MNQLPLLQNKILCSQYVELFFKEGEAVVMNTNNVMNMSLHLGGKPWEIYHMLGKNLKK